MIPSKVSYRGSTKRAETFNLTNNFRWVSLLVLQFRFQTNRCNLCFVTKNIITSFKQSSFITTITILLNYSYKSLFEGFLAAHWNVHTLISTFGEKWFLCSTLNNIFPSPSLKRIFWLIHTQCWWSDILHLGWWSAWDLPSSLQLFHWS